MSFIGPGCELNNVLSENYNNNLCTAYVVWHETSEREKMNTLWHSKSAAVVPDTFEALGARHLSAYPHIFAVVLAGSLLSSLMASMIVNLKLLPVMECNGQTDSDTKIYFCCCCCNKCKANTLTCQWKCEQEKVISNIRWTVGTWNAHFAHDHMMYRSWHWFDDGVFGRDGGTTRLCIVHSSFLPSVDWPSTLNPTLLTTQCEIDYRACTCICEIIPIRTVYVRAALENNCSAFSLRFRSKSFSSTSTTELSTSKNLFSPLSRSRSREQCGALFNSVL